MSNAIVQRIRAFAREWPEATDGPAHIVLADFNLNDGHLTWCIGLARAALDEKNGRVQLSHEDIELLDSVDWYSECDRAELTATVAFLEELLKIPESEREEADDASDFE